jgi:hypothetical protein
LRRVPVGHRHAVGGLADQPHELPVVVVGREQAIDGEHGHERGGA